MTDPSRHDKKIVNAMSRHRLDPLEACIHGETPLGGGSRRKN